jgi:zinc protease
VTAADIQRVARAYLKDQQSATIRYLPDSDRPANVREMPIELAPTVQTAALTRPPTSRS